MLHEETDPQGPLGEIWSKRLRILVNLSLWEAFWEGGRNLESLGCIWVRSQGEAPSNSFLDFLVLHEETEAPSSPFRRSLLLYEETEAPSNSLLIFLVLHEEAEAHPTNL